MGKGANVYVFRRRIILKIERNELVVSNTTIMNKTQDFLTFHMGNGKLSDGSTASSFQTALVEILSGKKKTHWSWYVMPTNMKSKSFGYRFALDRNETIAYIRNDLLLSNYLVFMYAVSNKLESGISPETLLMSKTDVIKAYDSAKWFNQFGSYTNCELFNVTNKIINQLSGVVQEYMLEIMISSIDTKKYKQHSSLLNQIKRIN